METIAYITVVLSFIVILWESRFFAREKKRVQKYPFFQLRDKIIWEIVTSQNHEEYERIYATVNSAIEKLDTFNFRFFSDSLSGLFEYIIGKAYQDNIQPSEILEEISRRKFNPLFNEYVKLIYKTARENSLLLRLAMTRLGFRILCTTLVLRNINRFRKKHENGKKHEKFPLIQGYSYLGYIARGI